MIEFGLVGVAMALALQDLILTRCLQYKQEDLELAAALIYVIAHMAISSSVLFPRQAALAGYWLRLCSNTRTDVYVEELCRETMNLAGATLIQLGQPDEFVMWLERALAKNPRLISARKSMENSCGARGEVPK